jgi:hypothetical protein
VSGLRRGVPPGVLPLLLAAALDLVFVAGLLRADRRPEQAWSPWLGIPAHVLALTLPLLLLVTVVVALTSTPGSGRRSRRSLARLQAATVVVAVLGFGVYVSPWGRAGVAAIVET